MLKKVYLLFFTMIFMVKSHAGDFTLLNDPYNAFNARYFSLTGTSIARKDFLAHEPNMDIDFSNAPKLDMIVLSTLVMTRDFIGTTILRLLDHHAQKGSEIYLIVTHQLIHSKEVGWLESFSALYKNVHFLNYKYFKMKAKRNRKSFMSKRKSLREDGKNFVSTFSWRSLQSTNHVKVFLTYSKSMPEKSFMISGGRNLSDMYFYTSPPDYSGYPDLVKWGSHNYEWAYFDDLDLETKSISIIEKVKNDLLEYFDSKGVKGKSKCLKNILGARDYLLSVPSENLCLSDYYLKMINSAKQNIKLISPYINFTKSIAEALIEAYKRGIPIEIITSSSIENDYLPFIIEPILNRNLRKYRKKFDFYLYGDASTIPHIKAMLIDDRVVSLGSVNMNRRSFFLNIKINLFN